MKKYVETSRGKVHYEPQTLYIGTKRIDKLKSKENLLLFKKVADEMNLSFSLSFGTLLGAIRENDFITHDEDIDLVVLEEDRSLLLDTLFELQKVGFKLIRYDRRGTVYSVMRNGEYIDVYLFWRLQNGIRKCFENAVYPEKYFVELTKHEFLGEMFNVPKEYLECLEFTYGENWRTPIQYANFEMPWYKKKLLTFIWFIFNEVIPLSLYKWLMKVNGEKKGLITYNNRVKRIKNKYPDSKDLVEYKF